MPRACHVAGCPKYAPCPDHGPAARKAQFELRRPTANARGYTYQWQKRRAAFLERFRWCEAAWRGVVCGAPATNVDHIIPKSAGGPDDELNWQPLCASCHSRKTARQSLGWGRARGGAEHAE
jgi:5-methylcytosine-specific restriction protein A